MKHLFLITTLLLSLSLFAQKKQPYVLYDAKGKKLSYEKMLKRLTDKDVLLFGEYHNNAIAHWLQLEVTKDLKGKRELVLGAEMFEQDNQEALDLYLAGTIKQKNWIRWPDSGKTIQQTMLHW